MSARDPGPLPTEPELEEIRVADLVRRFWRWATETNPLSHEPGFDVAMRSCLGMALIVLGLTVGVFVLWLVGLLGPTALIAAAVVVAWAVAGIALGRVLFR